MKPRAYSYLRMSTDIQLRGDSRRRQLALSRSYAEANGLELAKADQLEDIGISAFKGANMKEGALGRFVSAAENGSVPKGSFLLVENLDRLSRQKIKDSLALFLRIVGAGVNIVTLSDNRVFREEDLELNDLIMSILSLARAHDESVTKSKRLKEVWGNKKKKSADGVPMTRRLPSWLKQTDNGKGFEIIPERAAIVRSMYEDAASGVGMYTITARLNASGTKSFQGSGGFHQSYIAKTLKNRSVLGEFQPHKLVDGKRVPDGPVNPVYFPAIIEADLFYRAQSGKAQRKVSGKGRKGAAYSNLFGRLACCAYCHGPIHFENKGPTTKGGTYLVCSGAKRKLGCTATRWRYTDFEASFLAFVEELDLDSVINSNDEAALRKAVEDERATLQGEFDEKTIAREQTFSALAAGGPVEFLSGKLTEINTRLEELKTLMDVNEQKRQAVNAKRSRLGSNREEIRELVARLQAGPAEEVYKIRAQIASRLKSLVTIIWVAPLGSKPTTLKAIGELESMTNGEASDVITFQKMMAGSSESSRRYFAVGFEGGDTRAVYPVDKAPTETHLQIEATPELGIIQVAGTA